MKEQPRVVGLDLSLTSAGMSDGRVHTAFGTGPELCIEERLDSLQRSVMRFVRGRPYADLVVIEGSAFGAKGSAVEQLAGLRYMVRHCLWMWRIPFAIVAPTCLKTYTTGSGRATKAQMVTAVRERHGIDLSTVKVKDGRYDQADGLALAAMGYAYLGRPLPTFGPPPPRASLLAVDWPELYSDN